MAALASTIPTDELLTTEQVAALLNLAPVTLAGWRSSGAGPPWLKLARRVVRYRRSDLEAWMAASVRQGT